MKCNVCNNEIQDNTKFCKYCGTAVSSMSYSIKNQSNDFQTSSVRKSKTSIGAKILIVVSTMIVLVLASVVVLFFLCEKGMIDKMWQEEAVIIEDESTDVQRFGEDSQEESTDDLLDSQISVIGDVDIEESVDQVEKEFEHTSDYEVEAQDYILPESASRYIDRSELYGFTAEQCSIARNEIYARHGRKFNDENLQEYFDSLSWYEPTIEPADFEEAMLNSFEIANRDLIVEYEKECGYR